MICSVRLRRLCISRPSKDGPPCKSYTVSFKGNNGQLRFCLKIFILREDRHASYIFGDKNFWNTSGYII